MLLLGECVGRQAAVIMFIKVTLDYPLPAVSNTLPQPDGRNELFFRKFTKVRLYRANCAETMF